MIYHFHKFFSFYLSFWCSIGLYSIFINNIIICCLQNYYSVYGGQQFSPYYTTTTGASGPAGMYHNYYPFYAAQYAQTSSNQAQGFGVQYPQMVQYPYLPQHYGSSAGILSLPSSIPVTTTTSTTTGKNEVYPFPDSLPQINFDHLKRF